VLAVYLGVPHAIAVLTVPIIATNVWQTWQFRGSRATTTFLAPLLFAGVVGIVIGTLLLKVLPAAWSSLFLGIVLCAYIAHRLLRPAFTLSRDAGRRLALPIGAVAGALQGATGISSPIGVPFIHSMKLPRNDLIFAIAAMFLVFSVVQLPVMAIAGLYRTRFFLEGLISLVPVLIFMPVGSWLGRVLSAKLFDYLFLLVLSVIAVSLIYRASDTLLAGSDAFRVL
jgi:uncharacterized membrane protein YfcA